MNDIFNLREALAEKHCSINTDNQTSFREGFNACHREMQAALAKANAEKAHLTTELKRMHNCVYMSLLAATAYMGIPDHKREKFIKEQMENADYLLEKALSEVQE
jgi:hypothetical protein